MPRARHLARPIGRSTVLSRCCAAWIILLALSPFTAPFAVCQARDLVVADRGPIRPGLPSDDLGTWWIDGGGVADLPMTPMDEAIKEMSASGVSQVEAPLDPTRAASALAHPTPHLGRSGVTLLVVLRV